MLEFSGLLFMLPCFDDSLLRVNSSCKNVVNIVKIKKFVKIKSVNLCPVELINLDELIMV